MRFPTEKELASIRNKYPEGQRVRLTKMMDPQAPPIGTLGTVRYVDDMGDVGISWDTGSSLKLIPGEDEAEILVPDFTWKVRDAVLKIRDSGKTNMFDVNMVQRLAYNEGLYDLVLFIEDHRREYVHYILTGMICN